MAAFNMLSTFAAPSGVTLSQLRIPALALIILLVYGSRLTTGKALPTADGLSFPFKPSVVFARLAVMVIYVAFAIYYALVTGSAIPVWFYFVLVLVAALGMLQYPATITLGADAVTQRFWLLKPKRIGYDEVMTIQRFAAGRAIRVLGNNRTIITHTSNHSAPEIFAKELAERTGKTVQG